MKTFTGTVTSTKMAKTAAVKVASRWMHPVYKKAMKRTKTYLVHDEEQTTHVGDLVSFKPCRPLSARKHFMLIKILEAAPLVIAEAVKTETATKVAPKKLSKKAVKVAARKAKAKAVAKTKKSAKVAVKKAAK